LPRPGSIVQAVLTRVKHYSSRKNTSFALSMWRFDQGAAPYNTRAIFIVNKGNIVTYVEYVKEISNQPDYKAAMDAVKKLL